jgi:hypothetical protein
MDLVAGLHWLRENIPAFGGDPERITLLGHGTGAALSNVIAVSPVAKGTVQYGPEHRAFHCCNRQVTTFRTKLPSPSSRYLAINSYYILIQQGWPNLVNMGASHDNL